LKIRVFLGVMKFVNSYVERDKKNLQFGDFACWLPAHLIDFQLLVVRVLFLRLA